MSYTHFVVLDPRATGSVLIYTCAEICYPCSADLNFSHHVLAALDSSSSEGAATASSQDLTQNKQSEASAMPDARGSNGMEHASQPVAVRHGVRQDAEPAARPMGTMPAARVLDLVIFLAWNLFLSIVAEDCILIAALPYSSSAHSASSHVVHSQSMVAAHMQLANPQFT